MRCDWGHTFLIGYRALVPTRSFLLETRLPLRPDTIGADCSPSVFAGQPKEKIMQHANIMAVEHQGAAEKAYRTAVAPHFINEDKSDMRGIKSGWYAMDNVGKLVFGPFDTDEKCRWMIAEGV